ncbi:sugar phosphate isomerase/epimerase [Candidatus Aerophobetes bacterium]|uniref:Sugar phosphate isomerase/epimerase n=1 Tax=Aerophobetes bacterium TaxID=2030807 RepID=A0A523UZY8_UNCAE|nr:MAG: sugar phosphate isomerase/epimerase [Candidatus Aerophobetes bacterium]
MLERVKKYSVGIWALKGCADRFVPGGYEGEFLSTEEAIRKVAKIEGIKAVEFMSTDFDDSLPGKISSLLKENNLQVAGVLVNTFSRKWKLGSLSNQDPDLRKNAIEEVQRTVKISNELECDDIALWLGSDGFDYTFQVDYQKQWALLLETIGELAEEFPNKRFALEYKLKEPRKYLFVSSAMKALWVAKRLRKDNVGVLVDFGHALMSKENPAEAICILSEEKKLFGIHFNDAYREWDDDLVAGSVNLWDTLEFIYYLDKIGYEGWLSFDIFPFRMDASRAVELCIKNTENLIKLAKKIDRQKLAEAQRSMKAENSLAVIQEILEA